ncbi:endothelin-converting enzyme 1 [Trichonephila clavipes]|nr:endothelin-converting enzyme 1 [Trichonephila clavipes]
MDSTNGFSKANGNENQESINKKHNFWQRRSKLEKILLAVTGILLLLVIILFVISLVESHSDKEYCNTPACVTIAANIINFMDQSVDPCEDFYQYACGGWIKANPLPQNENNWDRYKELTKSNNHILKYILENENFTLMGEAEKKARTFYKSCMNQTRIEERGAEPLLDLLKKVVLYEGDTRNRWRDGPVCPDVDQELWRLGPDSSEEKTGKKPGERERKKKTGKNPERERKETEKNRRESNPQSNAVERVHRTIKRVIKALCVESGEDWEGVLPLALFSLRTVVHESTGFSSTELVMGKNLRTPQTLVYEEWMEEGNTSQSVVEYILQLNNRLKRCQDIAITRMKECQLKRKTWYDRDAVERKFVEGDLVMVLVTSKQNKLEVNWIGPGKVLSRISDTNYVIDLPGRRDRSTIYHVNLLKPYHRRPELVSLVVEEVSDDIEGDAEIPYPDKQCTKFDYNEILRESQLQLKLSLSQIDELKQSLLKIRTCFPQTLGRLT